MSYTWMEIIWLFFIYSFAGWVGEVCKAAIKQKKFVNRGFVNSPLCPIYGFAAALFALFLPELTENLFFLFLAGMVLSTILEYVTGILMEHIFHQKLWDYSEFRFHLDGYICLRYSLMWGVSSVLMMLFVNPFLCKVTGLLPRIASLAVLWTLSVLLFLDFTSTAMTVLGMQAQAKRLAQLTESIQHTSKVLENALTRRVQKRMQKSFPSIDMDTLVRNKQQKEKSTTAPVFAAGCSFYKLIALFFIGAFLGDITETIFCFFTMGRLMSRSSVVYGPFSIVWGLGCMLLTALLYRYKDKKIRYIFAAGVILGGIYEYICSVFTEIMFGTVFWDYSGFSLNLGGRINLLYCLFWGVAAVVWLKLIYPKLSALIEKIPIRPGTILCNCLIIFMIGNMIISSLALARYSERQTETGSAVEHTDSTLKQYLDEHFPDERMERIYPNAKIVK